VITKAGYVDFARKYGCIAMVSIAFEYSI
jgi:hypothetical protein